ncbi:hypothetical protein P2318_07540 [Myxococcaceae bacterium GXIMD 01537]
MPAERAAGATSLLDVLDRVLDRGVRFGAAARAALPHLPARSGAVRVVVLGATPSPPGGEQLPQGQGA